ncbi:MAG: hypothetical protein IPK57_12895 [Chitinophagaceae bacterium]|nr:hypothetical protein [Chitinophagaceae bacterium]
MKKVLFTLLLILPGFVLLAQTKPSADTAWKKNTGKLPLKSITWYIPNWM